MADKTSSGQGPASATQKNKQSTVLKDGVTRVSRPLSSLQPQKSVEIQPDPVFFLGNHALLLPMLGFGLAASLVAIMTLNHLPFGQMATNSNDVRYMSASADFQEIAKDCKALALELQKLTLEGNEVAYKVADKIMQPGVCKGYINPQDFGF